MHMEHSEAFSHYLVFGKKSCRALENDPKVSQTMRDAGLLNARVHMIPWSTGKSDK